MEEIQNKIKEINLPASKALYNFKEIAQPFNKTIKALKEHAKNTPQSEGWQDLVREINLVFSKYDLSELLTRIRFESEFVAKSLPQTYIDKINQVNVLDALSSREGKSHSLSSIAEYIYKEAEEDEAADDFQDSLSFEDIIEDIGDKKIGFQEKFYNKSEKYKKKFYIVFLVMSLIYNIFLEPSLQENVGKPIMTKIESKIMTVPNSKSEVADFIEVNTKAGIIGNERYYYKIIYIDSEGNLNEGYISKRSVFLIEDMETNDNK